MIRNITIIGAGNVGFHLAQALFATSLTITQVYSRKIEHASLLAKKVNAQPITQFRQLSNNCDLFILAVPDQVIEVVAKQLVQSLRNQCLIVHTSGATPAAVLSESSPRFGVFYPLQTFSRHKAVDFSNIPICLDANHQEDLDALLTLGKRISTKVYQITDEKRAQLHLAAVFANNFTNYLFHVATQILEEKELSFDLLKPLITASVQKIQDQSPAHVQTGPAIRGDEVTIQRHLNQLDHKADWQTLYDLLTKGIQKDLNPQ